MYTLDLSPFVRSTVGFDRLARIGEDALRFDEAVMSYRPTVGFDRPARRFDEAAMSYPPCNIEWTGEDSHRITMAVAGFGESDLTIETKEDVLVVTGRKEENEGQEDPHYFHHGIVGRDFVRRFKLADHVKVVGASIDNGLLQVDLERELPETMKLRKVEVTKGPSKLKVINKAKKLIETSKAA
jgi:molecular chaperone IbpA